MSVKWEDLPDGVIATWLAQSETQAFIAFLADQAELAKDEMVTLLEGNFPEKARAVACKAAFAKYLVSQLTPASPRQEPEAERPFRDPAAI